MGQTSEDNQNQNQTKTQNTTHHHKSHRDPRANPNPNPKTEPEPSPQEKSKIFLKSELNQHFFKAFFFRLPFLPSLSHQSKLFETSTCHHKTTDGVSFPFPLRFPLCGCFGFPCLLSLQWLYCVINAHVSSSILFFFFRVYFSISQSISVSWRASLLLALALTMPP